MHEYLRRLVLASANGVIPRRSVSDAVVYHDDNCPVHDDRMCNCDPWIELRLKDRTMWVQKDGTITTVDPSKQ